VTFRDEFIIEVWEATGKEVVGASELGLIEDAVVERFGSAISPASIARVLAEHGAPLRHPEILQADTSWRQKQSLFTAEDLEITNIEAANGLINKVEHLRQQFENDPPMREQLRQAVRSLKFELDSLSSSKQLAAEVAEWLTVWLQKPQIFAEWLDMRQNTADFRYRFLS
jgi:hypothetical protein